MMETMNFTPRRVKEQYQSEPLTERLSRLLDESIAARAKEEYAKGRGSGAGDVAKKRIGSGYIGLECDRQLAYRYHKIEEDPGAGDDSKVNPGELNRHAQVGLWLEGAMVKWMRDAGFSIDTHQEDGKQYGYKAAWSDEEQQYRMAGEVDGIIRAVPAQFPDIPAPCLWESKKATNKKFNKFVKEGVQKADATYYGQVQTNMAYMGFHATLFTMMNCDDMKIYPEVIRFNPAHAQRLSDRAVRVIQTVTPEEMPRITSDPTDFRCRFCKHKKRCWSQMKPEATNGPVPVVARAAIFEAPGWMK